MQRRLLTAVALATLVLLAGCAGLVGDGNETSPANDSDDLGDTPEATATASPTATAATTDTATDTESRVPDWNRPSPPNLPLQHKSNEAGENRMHTLEVREGIGSAESGYSSFVVEMTANTSMPNVDPADHGTAKGEPYFLVYVDGSIEFNSTGGHVDGTLVERSAIVGQKSNGTFAMWVPEEGMEETGVEPGEHEILVVLMDEDSEYDDIYGWKTVTVEYAPEE
ncbi:hypothetical protein ACKVMT_17155 [Halobacteriales archaeon Cl-PHB]